MNREPDGSWLQERLFERRIVSCRGVLDDALAGRVSAELMTLDALGDAAVELQLDARGASLEAAWTLIDVIDLLGVPVNIVCSGRVEGAAVGVLSAGAHRRALAHARFRLTDPELEISGRASELAALLDHHRRRLDRLHERVGLSTGRPAADVAADFGSGLSLDAGRGRPLPPRRRDRRGQARHPHDRRPPAPLGSHETARAERPSRLPARSAAPQLLVVRRSNELVCSGSPDRAESGVSRLLHAANTSRADLLLRCGSKRRLMQKDAR